MRCSWMALALGVTVSACGSSGSPSRDAPQSATAPSGGLALRGRLIDGTGAAPVERGIVVLVGDRVVCAGPEGACRVPVGVEVVDVREGTILPGLIDLHVHSRPHFLAWFLVSGVTTIRDANNSFATIEGLLAAPDRPRIVWTGPMLDGPRTVMRHFGEEGVLRPGAPDLENAFTIEVTTPEEAVAAVDNAAERGATFVKLYEQLSLEVFRAAAARARERGLRVMTDLGMHSTRGLAGAEVDALQAVEAGVHTIEHASGYALAYQRLGGDPLRPPFDPMLIDSLARATVRAGVAVVPTLSVFYSYSDSVDQVSDLPVGDRMPGGIPQDMVDFFQQGAERRSPGGRESSLNGYLLAREVARRVSELGGLVGAGSDAPAGVFNIPGGSIHRELELLVRAGMTPLQAIHAATGAAATILARPDIGVLRPGAAADVLVVDGNPAERITDTRRIRMVVAEGRIVQIDSLLPRVAGMPMPDTEDRDMNR